jgi:predicted transcriptional regulator
VFDHIGRVRREFWGHNAYFRKEVLCPLICSQKLLQLILEEQPQSLKELEVLSGRSASNLSRTLKTMARYGIVELEKKQRRIVPRVKASDFRVEFGIRRQGH